MRSFTLTINGDYSSKDTEAIVNNLNKIIGSEPGVLVYSDDMAVGGVAVNKNKIEDRDSLIQALQGVLDYAEQEFL